MLRSHLSDAAMGNDSIKILMNVYLCCLLQKGFWEYDRIPTRVCSVDELSFRVLVLFVRQARSGDTRIPGR